MLFIIYYYKYINIKYNINIIELYIYFLKITSHFDIST